jgi:glucans biosynthesis protein C
MPEPAPNSTPSLRRVDLDWLRIGALLVLIVYHTGMYYVSWGWHIKSPHAGPWLEPVMLAVNPWRLLLLFFIAGAATRFMLDAKPARAIAAQRAIRLGPPLLMGVVLIVPPQTFAEVAQRFGQAAAGAPLDFYGKYLTGAGQWCSGGDCLITPTWNHLWFIVYLLVYTLIACATWPLLRALFQVKLGAKAAGLAFLIGPPLWLFAMRSTLWPQFGAFHNLATDFYSHAIYAPMVLLGMAAGKWEAGFALAMRVRWGALAAGVAGYVMLICLREAGPDTVWLARSGREILAWAAIIALIGFARRHLAHQDGPARRWLTQAVFPMYLVHQTVIILLAVGLAPLGLPAHQEGPLLLAGTLTLSFVFAALAFAAGPLRVWLGLAEGADRGKPVAEKGAPPHVVG